MRETHQYKILHRGCHMALSKEETKKSLEILKALDEAIEKCQLDDSLYFRGIRKKLTDARERFIAELDLDAHLKKLADAESPPQTSLEESQFVEVYISLYQAEGANIRKWENILSSITALSVSRPAYKNEEDVAATIRAKAHKINDAYVAVKVHKDDLLKSSDKLLADRAGKEVLALREGVIRPQNITRFVHVSGVYKFRNGSLIKLA